MSELEESKISNSTPDSKEDIKNVTMADAERIKSVKIDKQAYISSYANVFKAK
jgi:hypothetical protein